MGNNDEGDGFNMLHAVKIIQSISQQLSFCDGIDALGLVSNEE